MKAIIFDASTIISFSMNGMFEEFRNLKKIFNGKFIITKEVKSEIIDKPLTIKRFEFEALRLKALLDEKIIEMPSCLGVDENKISEDTKKLLDEANKIFIGQGKNIHLLDLGETSCLVLSRILDGKGIKNVVAIDERTTRMLSEKPENLKKLLQRKLHTKIIVKHKNFKSFAGFKFIRSAELVYVAYKKGLIKLKNGKVLDVLLWALKFKGCSISGKEINEIKKLK